MVKYIEECYTVIGHKQSKQFVKELTRVLRNNTLDSHQRTREQKRIIDTHLKRTPLKSKWLAIVDLIPTDLGVSGEQRLSESDSASAPAIPLNQNIVEKPEFGRGVPPKTETQFFERLSQQQS